MKKFLMVVVFLFAAGCEKEDEDLKSIETYDVLVLDENFPLDDYQSITVWNRLEIRCRGESCADWSFDGIEVICNYILVESDIKCSEMCFLLNHLERKLGGWIEKSIYDCEGPWEPCEVEFP